MFEKMKAALRSRNSRQNWSRERWYDHLMENAMSESEKNEIHAIFNRS